MLKDVDIALYFLKKDIDGKYFNKNLIELNGHKLYQGNARLNKYLHLAQNIFIAKTGEKLFDEDLYAYANGAVSLAVQENYAVLLKNPKNPIVPDGISVFLDKIYEIFKNADIDELIELSHEDDEWVEKHSNFRKADQRMNSMAHISDYKKQYADIIKVMDRLPIYE